MRSFSLGSNKKSAHHSTPSIEEASNAILDDTSDSDGHTSDNNRHSLVSSDYEGSYWSKIVDIRLCADFAAVKFTNGTKKLYSKEEIKNTALKNLFEGLIKDYMPSESYLTKDFAISWRGGRWRGQLYHCTSGWMVSLRQMPYKRPHLARLGFDLDALLSLSEKSGLVLFAGPTGAGKSTTLAGLMYELQERDILGDTVTIEDPIEFLYDDPFILQREVGVDVESFHAGIHEAMRQSPETIMIGEIRHHKTAEIAVQAGLTGHRVLATIHAESVEEACGRMFSMLDDHHDEILPQAIQGIVAQHIVRNKEGRVLTLYETLKFDRPARSVLAAGPDSLARLSHEQFRQGRESLKDSAMRLLSDGLVDRKDLTRWLDD